MAYRFTYINFDFGKADGSFWNDNHEINSIIKLHDKYVTYSRNSNAIPVTGCGA
jgi:hypothetical protein